MWILTDASRKEHTRFFSLDHAKEVFFASKEIYMSDWVRVQEVTREEAERELADDGPDTLYLCAVCNDGTMEFLETLYSGPDQQIKVAAILNAIKDGLMSGTSVVDLESVLSGI